MCSIHPPCIASGSHARPTLSRPRLTASPNDLVGGSAVRRRARKIALSIKALEVVEEKRPLAQYGSAELGASLGDILGAALKPCDKGEKAK